jgi:hypothetical protein
VRLLDERRRLFGIVNPIDLVALFLAVAVAVVVVFVLAGGSPTEAVSTHPKIEIEMVAVATVPDIGDFDIQSGDVVSRVGGGEIGTLESFEIKPSASDEAQNAGAVLMTGDEPLVDIWFTIRGSGTFADDGASMGEERIRQNQILELQLPLFRTPARIWSISSID